MGRLYFEIFNFLFSSPGVTDIHIHTYVLVANFGEEHVNLKPVGQIYSGGELVLDSSNTLKLIEQASKICSPPE